MTSGDKVTHNLLFLPILAPPVLSLFLMLKLFHVCLSLLSVHYIHAHSSGSNCRWTTWRVGLWVNSCVFSVWHGAKCPLDIYSQPLCHDCGQVSGSPLPPRPHGMTSCSLYVFWPAMLNGTAVDRPPCVSYKVFLWTRSSYQPVVWMSHIF